MTEPMHKNQQAMVESLYNWCYGRILFQPGTEGNPFAYYEQSIVSILRDDNILPKKTYRGAKQEPDPFTDENVKSTPVLAAFVAGQCHMRDMIYEWCGRNGGDLDNARKLKTLRIMEWAVKMCGEAKSDEERAAMVPRMLELTQGLAAAWDAVAKEMDV